MDVIRIPVVVGEDRHLVIDLPAEVPVGPAELVIRPLAQPAEMPQNPERERIRARLLAAGLLVTDIRAPEGTVPLTPEERQELSKLFSDTRSSLDLINRHYSG